MGLSPCLARHRREPPRQFVPPVLLLGPARPELVLAPAWLVAASGLGLRPPAAVLQVRTVQQERRAEVAR